MTLLSRKTDYALLILSYLHGHAGGGCARTIAEHFGLSRAFVANILKELCQKGFVTSHRGVKGGYGLQRPARAITLAELLETLDDGFRLANCNTHREPEDHEDECVVLHICPIKGPIGELHRRILETLQGISLADIFQPNLPAATFQPVLATLGMRESFAALDTN
jgi:Rrf2 family transcriptional regulator, cysteine metabolism repressor